MLVKILIVIVLFVIIGSLGSALYHLAKESERSVQTVKVLTTRITLSITLFIFLIIAFASGWIAPHGINKPMPIENSAKIQIAK